LVFSDRILQSRNYENAHHRGLETPSTPTGGTV
jgi:hypothetical protein